MLKTLLGNALLSHAALAGLYSLVLFGVIYSVASLEHACSIPFLIVTVFFFGREAGQWEHDFKRDGVDGFASWYRSLLFVSQGTDATLQWVVPVLSSGFVCGMLYLFLR